MEFDESLLAKVKGCLAGVALGDAFGMPTASLLPAEIRRRFVKVESLLDAPIDHPLHAGLRRGQVTDDTQLTMVIVRMILEDGRITRRGVASRLVNWVLENRLLETRLLGPSTIRAVQGLIDGKDPSETGRQGITNGAAMKIAPIGIINVGNPMEKLIDDVEEVCMPTHWTGVAISAASAVAAAIAEGLRPSSTLSSLLKAAKTAAQIGERRGTQLAYPSIDKRIDLALKLVKNLDPAEAAETLYVNIGADISCVDSIPTAFGLLSASDGDPLATIISAANMGGDTDTIASIAGGMAGAFRGSKSLPEELVKKVDEVNHLELESTSAQLLSFARGYR